MALQCVVMSHCKEFCMKKSLFALLSVWLLFNAIATAQEEEKVSGFRFFSDGVPRYEGFALGGFITNQWALGKYSEFALCNIGGGVYSEYTLPLSLPNNIDLGLNVHFDFNHVIPKKNTTLKSDEEIRFTSGAWLRLPFTTQHLFLTFQPEVNLGLSLFMTQGQNGSEASGVYTGLFIEIAPAIRMIPDALDNFEIEAAPLITILPEKEHVLTMIGMRFGVIYHIQSLLNAKKAAKQEAELLRQEEEARRLAEEEEARRRAIEEAGDEEARRIAEEELRKAEEERKALEAELARKAEIAAWPNPLAKLNVEGGKNFTPDGDGQNDTVTFIPGIEYIEEVPESWTLAILDPQGNPFRTISGKGDLPESITWDGLSEKGEVVFSRNVYTAKLTVIPSKHDRARSGAKNAEVTQPINTGLLLQVIVPEHEWKIVVNTIYFAGGGATFTGLSAEQLEATKETLDEIAQQINDHPGVDVIVEGYANNVSGTEKEDKEELIPLSQERADFIVQELVGRGIDADKLTATGKGGANPLAARKDRANWWKNRRIEFTIKK